ADRVGGEDQNPQHPSARHRDTARSVPPDQRSNPKSQDAVSDTNISTGTLGKALEVLDVIASADRPMRFTDILNRLDQPRGTLHRQISNLAAEGLVTADENHAYVPGLRLLKLAARAWSRNSLRSVAAPHLLRLHEATGETVHLGVLNGLEVVYLDKVESRQTVRMHSQVGNASPLFCTGVGKAMLARLSLHDRADRAERMHYTRHTPSTLVSAEALLAEVDHIARTGLAYDREEHEPGIVCVAASIQHPEGEGVAGLSVTGPAYRMGPEQIARFGELVRETAKNIEIETDARLGPRHRE
ncbi:MAG: IclR family transcriptional regulator, partial [Pseudomonadota bacterium]